MDKIDWEHIYLLGWHSPDGKLNLTSWVNKKLPWKDVVIVGADNSDMQHIMWNNPLHKQLTMLSIPSGTNPLWFAKQNNGIRAFGWYIENGIQRPPMKPLKDPWEWFNNLKGIHNG